MLRIAICDDESLFTEELERLISSYMMEKGLVFKIDAYGSGEANYSPIHGESDSKPHSYCILTVYCISSIK